jgi:hypothetical protein
MRNYVAALVGLATLFPARLIGGVNFRSNDLVAALLVGAAAYHVLGDKREWRVPAIFVALALLTLGWLGAELNYRAYLPWTPSAAMILARWIVAIPAAFYLALLSQEVAFRRFFVAGAILGCLLTAGSLAFDFWTFQHTGAPAFPVDGSEPSFVNGDFRAGGIIGMANGAAIASLFVIPLLISAAEEFGWRRIPVAGIPVLAVVFYTTQTRSASIAAAFLLLVWGLMRRPVLVLIGVAWLAILGGLLYAIDPNTLLPSGGGSDLITMVAARFNDDQATQNNAGERSSTTRSSLDLALHHPFGMGSTYEAPLDEATGFAATHNGLLQLALLGGIPLALLVTAQLVIAALGLRAPPRPTHEWLALYVLIVSMFESTYYIPFFSTIVLWIVARTSSREDIETAGSALPGEF